MVDDVIVDVGDYVVAGGVVVGCVVVFGVALQLSVRGSGCKFRWRCC